MHPAGVKLPDSASQTLYRYQGEATTVIDPAGKWKQYFIDSFGNLVAVPEPGPAASPVPAAPNPPPSFLLSSAPQGMLPTSYTYDALNHLTMVTMPRNVGRTLVTQTRTYDSFVLLCYRRVPSPGNAFAIWPPSDCCCRPQRQSPNPACLLPLTEQRVRAVTCRAGSERPRAHCRKVNSRRSVSTTWGATRMRPSPAALH